MNFFRLLLYNLWYFLERPPWESGIVPPEVDEFIRKHKPGRALDLGCGSGTSSIALAKAGWKVTGIDFAWRAIRMARLKARRDSLRVEFLTGDVIAFLRVRRYDPKRDGTDLEKKYDLILDIGCFHGLRPHAREVYIESIAPLLSPGGTWLVYAFVKSKNDSNLGLSESDISAACKRLTLIHREGGRDHQESPSAWFWFIMPPSIVNGCSDDHTKRMKT